MATFFFQNLFGVEENIFSLGIINMNTITFNIVAVIMENAISLFSIPKNSLNPNIHIASNPNIIIRGRSESSSGKDLPNLMEIKPTNTSNTIKPSTILITC